MYRINISLLNPECKYFNLFPEISAKSIAEIKENYVVWENKVIRVKIYAHGDIEQIEKDWFRTYLFDEDYTSICTEFGKEAKAYVSKKILRVDELWKKKKMALFLSDFSLDYSVKIAYIPN